MDLSNRIFFVPRLQAGLYAELAVSGLGFVAAATAVTASAQAPVVGLLQWFLQLELAEGVKRFVGAAGAGKCSRIG